MLVDIFAKKVPFQLLTEWEERGLFSLRKQRWNRWSIRCSERWDRRWCRAVPRRIRTCGSPQSFWESFCICSVRTFRRLIPQHLFRERGGTLLQRLLPSGCLNIHLGDCPAAVRAFRTGSPDTWMCHYWISLTLKFRLSYIGSVKPSS